MDAAEVDDDVVGVGGDLVDPSDQPFGRAEEQAALDLDQADSRALLVEAPALVRGAHALRAHHVAGKLAADDGAAVGVVAEDMEPEGLGDLLADLDAADAVAVRVEPRREDADADLARDHGDDAAGDAALGRHADLVGPLAGIVVHAAAVHHREHVLDVVALERAHRR